MYSVLYMRRGTGDCERVTSSIKADGESALVGGGRGRGRGPAAGMHVMACLRKRDRPRFRRTATMLRSRGPGPIQFSCFGDLGCSLRGRRRQQPSRRGRVSIPRHGVVDTMAAADRASSRIAIQHSTVRGATMDRLTMYIHPSMDARDEAASPRAAAAIVAVLPKARMPQPSPCASARVPASACLAAYLPRVLDAAAFINGPRRDHAAAQHRV